MWWRYPPLTILARRTRTGRKDKQLHNSLALLHDAALAAMKRIEQDTRLKDDIRGLESLVQQHGALDALVQRMTGLSLVISLVFGFSRQRER